MEERERERKREAERERLQEGEQCVSPLQWTLWTQQGSHPSSHTLPPPLRLLPLRLTSCSLMFPLRLLCMHMIMWVIVYVRVLKVCEPSLTCYECVRVCEEFNAWWICKEEEALTHWNPAISISLNILKVSDEMFGRSILVRILWTHFLTL